MINRKGRGEIDHEGLLDAPWFVGASVPEIPSGEPGLNVRAFLAMLAASEGTDREPEPYRVVFGYGHVIADMSDHPSVTGEWAGMRLPDHQCNAAGYSPGCVSTAAGRYQITRTTWQRARDVLALPDFSPDSQDRAAVWLIHRRGALDAVMAGDVTHAIWLVRKEWASLPGNTYQQSQRPAQWLLAQYQTAGGRVA